jgi:hypothetical protein
MSDVGVYFQSLATCYTPGAMGSGGQCVEAGQPLTFEWNEQNTGTQDVSYTDFVSIDGTVSASLSLTLSPGSVESRRVSIDSGVIGGGHTAVIIISSGDAAAEGFTQQTIDFCAQ